MSQRAAIATTLRNAGAVLESFLDYHFAIGFDRIFLFFDDPDDASIPLAEAYDDVTVFRHDETLRDKWAQTPLFEEPEITEHIDTEVMARQMLNTQVGVRQALEEGIDWLLHIDIDELFYSFDQSVEDHFQALAEQDVDCMSYWNHEAVPERADVDDFFREVTLFKRNLNTRREPKLKPWHLRLIQSIPQIPRKFFFFYGNGKSAARVSEDLVVSSVHGFRLPEGATKERAGRNPVILHYPCCGFRHFWDKYRTLGVFDDKWFGVRDIAQTIGTFHTESRDLVAAGDREAARRFYEERVVLDDEETIRQLMDYELLLRITEPADFLCSAEDEEQDADEDRDEDEVWSSAQRTRRGR